MEEERIFLLKSRSGMTVRVPESKMVEWQRHQDALTDEEVEEQKQKIEKLRKMLSSKDLGL